MARINASSQGVQVHGLNELNRALRELGPGLQRELKGANLDVARFVADDAESAARSLGGVAAKAAPSIKAAARNVAAGVSFGGSSAPYAMGAEFGGGRRSTTQQFKPWRGSGSGAGYFVYPTIRRDAERIEDEYGEAIDDLLRKVGLK